MQWSPNRAGMAAYPSRCSMSTRPPPASTLYALERSDVGVVQLDRELRVVSMNSLARRVLPVEEMQPFEKMVLDFHPERSVAKVKFLLDQADCPVGNPPPMTMIINIPERVLLIKVTKMSDVTGVTQGYVLIFHDVTDAVSTDTMPVAGSPAGAAPKRQLQKIPTVAHNSIGLVDADDIIYIRAEGHYTWITTAAGASFCNLNIGDLEERLDGEAFLRIHRSYIANLRHAERILRQEGRTVLKLRGEAGSLPVSRTSAPKLLSQLGLAGSDEER